MHATTTTEISKGFYTWSFPGAPIQVRLSLKVVQEIRSCLAQAQASALPGRLQGILLGHIAAPDLSEITRLCQLQTGNPDELENAIASIGNCGDNLVPIGYFRTHAGHLALSAEDLALAETHFSHPNCVFLLIDGSGPEPPNAGFFYWDRGKMNGGFHDFCFLEFPLDVATLSLDGHNKSQGTREPEPEPPPQAPLSPAAEPIPTPKIIESEPKPKAPEPILPWSARPPLNIEPQPAAPPALPVQQASAISPTPKPRRLWRVAGVALLAAACFVTGIFVTPKLTDLFTGFEQRSMGLKVQRQGNDLSVTWNRDSKIVSQADGGQLIVQDGTTRQFPLDKKHIQSGSILYSPMTAQVRVQLDIQTSDHRAVTESVDVILNRPELTESSGIYDRMQIPESQHVLTVYASRPDKPAVAAPPKPANAKARPRRDFQPPRDADRAAPSQTPELAPPPPVTGIRSASAPPIAPAIAPPPVLPRGQPPPAKAKAAPAAKPQTPAPPPTSTRLADRLSPVPAYIPAVPIRQVPPTRLPAAQRSFLSHATVVEIKVSIDASGKVHRTEPLTSAHPALVTAARTAASLWRFQPARRNGLPVASDMVLRFKFDPAQ